MSNRRHDQSESFGERLRTLRRAAGLSQEALAERAGLTTNAIGALERGERRQPYPDTIRRLADALELDEIQRASLSLTLSPREPTAGPGPGLNAVGLRAFPADLTSFVGRQREVADVCDLLTTSTRLLTLIGPGGVGKTRLATHCAELLAHHFPDGIWFVDLAPVRSSESLETAIAHQLSPHLGGSSQFQLHDMLAGIMSHRCLLVIDNMEQVVDGAPMLLEMLVQTSHLKLLVTSRSPLRVRGEQEYRIPPLDVSTPTDTGQQGTPAFGDAVQLFVDRAQSVVSSFQVTSDNAAVVEDICRMIDGLPLALELAAARVSLLPLPLLRSELSKGLDILSNGAQDLPERQQTMRQAIAWSYDLLSAPEQMVFRRLAIFAGGCTSEAADAVCDPAGYPRFIDVLTGLVRAGLVTFDHDTDGDVRIRLLLPIRKFADACLEGLERDQTHQRHATCYRTLALDVEPRLQRADQLVWLAYLRRERHNLHQAIGYFTSNQQLEPAIDIVWSLWRFWWLSGQQQEARQWLEHIVDAMATSPEPIDDMYAGRAQTGLGSFAWAQGDDQKAQPALDAGIAHARQAGDTRTEAIGLTLRGLIRIRKNDLDTAHDDLTSSSDIARQANDPWVSAWTLSYLGILALVRHQHGLAEQHFADSLAMASKAEDRQPVSEALYYLGQLALTRGDSRSAGDWFAQGLQIALEIQEPILIGCYLRGLADILTRIGDVADAVELLGYVASTIDDSRIPWYMDMLDRPVREHVLNQAHLGLGPEKVQLLLVSGSSLQASEAVEIAHRASIATHGLPARIRPESNGAE